MEKKLSIVTINYNNDIGLEKTIKSVINQTYKNFDYLVIDGGSSDTSKEIISKYASNINYWVSEKDKGIYNAMNKGISASKSEYILFINSGDVLNDNMVIEKAIQNLNEDFDFVTGNLFYNNNGINNMLSVPPDELSFTYFIYNSLPHPATFFKRELFFKHFLYNEDLKIIADWEFFIYCICKMNCSYKHIDLIISNFDDTGVSSNLNNVEKIQNERKIVFDKHFAMFKSEIKIIEEYYGKVNTRIRKVQETKYKWSFLNFLLKKFSKKAKAVNNPYQSIYKKL